MKRLLISLSVVLSGLAFMSPTFAYTQAQVDGLSQSSGLSTHIIKLALNGYDWANKKGEVKNSKYLTIVNFNQLSKDKRMYVLNLDTNQMIMHMYVANGHNSGLYKATQFSNKTGTHESSLGVYVTAFPYTGKHGLEMRVRGLEQGINNNVWSRAIVLHPALYATPSFVKKFQRTGRSFGCFAVNPAKSTQLIDKIKGGSVIFAYAQQENTDPVVAV